MEPTHKQNDGRQTGQNYKRLQTSWEKTTRETQKKMEGVIGINRP